MAVNVKELEPISFGIPTHAPKLWRMLTTEESARQSRTLKFRLGLLRRTDRLLDELQPLPTNRFLD